MKTLIESLFDKDLTEKEYEINPLSIAYDWELFDATNGSYEVSKGLAFIFKAFDPEYIKQHGPSAKEIKSYYNSHHTFGKFAPADFAKILKMAYVIGTWSKELVPKKIGWLDSITVQTGSAFANGRIYGIDRGVQIRFSTSENSGGLFMTVTMRKYAIKGDKQVNILFKHKDN